MINVFVNKIVQLIIISPLIYCQSNILYETGTNIEIQSGADVCANSIVINGSYTGTGTICQGALPVLLSSFTFSVNKNNVSLTWTTESEINNKGFDIEIKELSDKAVWLKKGFVQGTGNTNEQVKYYFEDKKLRTGKYNYRLKQIDYNGNFEYFSLETDVIINVPGKFEMTQNYPNPSNPKTKIDYELPVDGLVTIKLYNLLGQEVKVLVNEVKDAGYYTAEFDGTNLASGIYIYIMKTESFTNTRKMVLVK